MTGHVGQDNDFWIKHKVAEDELDDLGHVSNINYVKWLDQVTRDHNSHFNLGQSKLIEKDAVFVVHKHELVYVNPLFVNDEIEIHTRVMAFNRFKHSREYQIVKAESNKTIFTAKTQLVCVSFSLGKLKKIPNEYLQHFNDMTNDLSCHVEDG